MLKSFCAAASLAVTAIAVPAHAAQITPVSVAASSTQGHGGVYKAENLINSSGLSGGLHDNYFGNMWMTEQGTGAQQGVLTFDLGAAYKLASADIWQFNYADGRIIPGVINTIDRGVKDFRILTSLDGVDYAEVFAGTLLRGDGTPAAAQVFGLNGVEARFVQIDILNTYATGTIYTTYSAGLSEVRFNAVPEPATWAMMIGGFGLVGGAMRRTRRTARIVAA